MNITLHQATEQVREMLDQIDPETGELPDGYAEARSIVQNKAVAVAAYIIESEVQTEAIRNYIKAMNDRVKSAEKRQEWLRRYLQDHMAAAGISEIKDERGLFKASLAYGRDEAVEVFDSEQIPKEYMRETIKIDADKTAIKKAIKEGREIPGARLLKRDRLTIK